jgi:hypothetical protein
MTTKIRATVGNRTTKPSEKADDHLISSMLMNNILDIVKANDLNFAIEFLPTEESPWFFSVFKHKDDECLFCFEGDTLEEAVEDTVDRLREIYDEPVL